MLVNDIDPIRKKIVVKIHNYDKHINFSALKISQQVLAHAEFEFFWSISDKITTEPLEDFESFKKFFGAEVMFSFFNFLTQKEMLFKGLIDSMEIRNQDGASAGFLVKGHSHTIAMEDLKYSRMHLGRTLQEIVAESLKGQAVGMWEIKDIAPANNPIIASSLQSNEHGWKYICRLARNFGQWLYWDGTRLQFGRLKDSKMVLVNGVHLKSFGMGSRLLSNKSSYSGYDHEAGALIEGQLEKTDDNFNDSLMTTSLNAQKLQFIRKMDREIPFHSYSSNAQHQSDIDQMNKLDAAGKAAMMVTYSVESHVPVYVGHIVTVKNKTVDHVMIVTKSEIRSIGVGNLTCGFEAIPVDAKHPPYTNSEKHGKAKAQPALVLDNNDPAGMGRVRVKFFWGKSDNESDWLRVQTVHGGNGKGFYFIPEIGEEVRVCFEGGNPDRGFVSGSNFNGKEISGYADSGNNVKAIHTRNGTKILLNDGEGSVFIEDASGNTWLMDGKGNIGVNAPKRLTLNATDIEMNAYNNLELNVGNNMIMNVMTKLFVFTPQLQQIVSGFMSLFSGKALINSSDIIDIEAKELNAVGTKKMFIHSDEKAVINSKGVAEMHGTSGNKLSNQASDRKIVASEEISLATVEFRTLEDGTYNGEFGFDWLRLADNGFTHEPDYASIILGGYKDGIADLTKMEATANLQNEYIQIPIKRKVAIIGENYYVPYLTLFDKIFSETNTIAIIPPPFKATLRVLVEIEEDLDKLEFDYDKTIFTINKPILIDKTICAKKESADKIEIICNNEITTDSQGEIRVYAYPKGSTSRSASEEITLRRLAGKILVKKNSATQRKELKFVLVGVRTNITAIPIVGEVTGEFTLAEKTNLYNTMYQALIVPQVIEKDSTGANIILNLVSDINFMTGGKYVDTRNLIIDNATDNPAFKEQGTHIYLKEQFNITTANKYADYFTAFSFKVASYFAGGMGIVQYRGVKNLILTIPRDNFTLNHEGLHGLNLSHTFQEGSPIAELERKYTFNSESATDNVMSYSPTSKISWNWQWEEIRKHI